MTPEIFKLQQKREQLKSELFQIDKKIKSLQLLEIEKAKQTIAKRYLKKYGTLKHWQIDNTEFEVIGQLLGLSQKNHKIFIKVLLNQKIQISYINKDTECIL